MQKKYTVTRRDRFASWLANLILSTFASKMYRNYVRAIIFFGKAEYEARYREALRAAREETEK